MQFQHSELIYRPWYLHQMFDLCTGNDSRNSFVVASVTSSAERKCFESHALPGWVRGTLPLLTIIANAFPGGGLANVPSFVLDNAINLMLSTL